MALLRFSDGCGAVNQRSLDFNSRLVDELPHARIQPKVTPFHWDPPQALQELGGWPARDTTAFFGEYARIVFDHLGDHERLWATHNEPWGAAFPGHAYGLHAPGICDYSQAYQAAHHLLLFHGKAVQVFRQGGYQGKIGFILDLNGPLPASDREEDVAATKLRAGSGGLSNAATHPQGKRPLVRPGHQAERHQHLTTCASALL